MITCARSASRLSVSATRWAVTPPMPASISSKTSVSPPATTASASATRESSPPDAVSATGPKGMPGIGPDQEDGLVPARSVLARAPAARRGTRPRPCPPLRFSATAAANGSYCLGLAGAAPPLARRSAPRPRRARPLQRRAGRGHRRARRARRRALLAPLEQLLERLGGEAAAELGDQVEPGLDLLDSRRVGVERGDERCRSLPTSLRRTASSRSSAVGASSSGASRSAARAPALLRLPAMLRRRRRRVRPRRSPGPRPRRARPRGACGRARREASPPRLLEPVGALDEVAQRLDASAAAPASRAISSLPTRPRRAPARPPVPRAAAALLGADEGVQDVELVRGPCKPALLELARHRDQPLGRSGEILARDRPSPRVGPRAAVGEDAPSEDEARLVLRPQLRERLQAPSSKNPRERRARPRRMPRSRPGPLRRHRP